MLLKIFNTLKILNKTLIFLLCMIFDKIYKIEEKRL